jgi:hypothetical protein
MKLAAWIVVVAVAVVGANAGRQPRQIEFLGPAGSVAPHLAAGAGGEAVLTWLVPGVQRKHALRFAVRRAGGWSAPQTILESDSLFVNWADFPSLIALPDGRWIVHWLARVPGGTYAYHVRTAASTDRGRTWREPVVPHRDGSPREHGFVSMATVNDSTTGLIWLDGRNMTAPEQGEMSLRFTELSSGGRLAADELLDGRTCECCQTALVRTPRGLVAAYRDRSATGIRDIAILRRVAGAWTAPVTVARDDWDYPGCPVNGPQLAASGDTVAVAWFTAPGGRARVMAAWSFDAGATWTTPLQLDDGRPLGRVDIELLRDGSALVAWLEVVGEAAEVRARRARPDGGKEASFRVAETAQARSSGFPRMVRIGDDVLVAWTSSEGVRVASFPVAR